MKRQISFKEAASVVLHAAQAPLHYGVITTRAMQEGLVKPSGRTPAATMNSALSHDIKENGAKSEFVQHGNGMYGLNPHYTGKGRQRREARAKRKRKARVPRGERTRQQSRPVGPALQDYVESGVDLGTNYELVILRYLLKHKTGHHGRLAEELTRYNGLNDSSIDDVQRFINVPHLERLGRLGFVVNHGGKAESEWLYELDAHEAANAMELLTDKLGDYQQKHNLPASPKSGRGIDWRLYADKLSPPPTRADGRPHGGTQAESPPTPDPAGVNSWIWSADGENFKIARSMMIWGSQAPVEKIQERVRRGDLIALYITEKKGFAAVCELAGEWYRSPKPVWGDEAGKIVYRSQVQVKWVKEGLAPMGVLADRLSIFQDKTANRHFLKLRSGQGYPGNNGKPIPPSDMQIILDSL